MGVRTGLLPDLVHAQDYPWRNHGEAQTIIPKMITSLSKRCGNERCKEDHKPGDCLGGDCETTEDHTFAVIDAIHMGFQLCCSFPSVDVSAPQGGGKYLYPKGYFSSDYVTPCVD
jgi:hypothetical protein